MLSASAPLFFAFLVLPTFQYDSATSSSDVELRTNRVNGTNAAVCRDAQLAQFINTGVAYYIHDMNALAQYILNQIKAARKPGQWLVHAQVIAGTRQGKDWQSLTNGDIFSGQNPYSCFYHDLQTYVLVLKLY